MKDKKMTYVLLGAVAIIWGLVIYRIFSGISSSDDEYTMPSIQNTPIVVSDSIKDTYALSLSYPDPFMKGIAQASISPSQTFGQTSSPRSTLHRRAQVHKPVAPSIPFDWSILKYQGTIINKNTGKYTALVKVKVQDKLVKEGDTLSGVKIVKIWKDSLRVSNKNQFKILKR